jgi:gliding motility-associated-like protein
MKNMKQLTLLIILGLFSCMGTFAQVPQISNISTRNLYPKGTIVITGSGFSNTSSNLRVIFGHVEGKVISSSEFSIEVEVPPAAKFSNIEVINTASRRMTKSNDKFLPTFYGNGFNASSFTSTLFDSSQELRDICSCDLNNDGWPDLITSKFSAASDIMVMKNTTNPATPHLINFSKELFSVGFSTDHIACGDVDGDGKPDLVITKGGSTNRNAVFLMLNKSTSTTISLDAPYSIALDINHVATQASLRDLNKDGRPELIVTNSTYNIVYVFPNDPTKPVGTNPFLSPVKIPLTGGPANSYGLEVQDFDGDGLPDILINPISSADHFILRNNSGSTIEFAAPVKVAVPGQLRNVIAADINNDGKPDLITTSTNTHQVMVTINRSTAGNFQFNAPMVLATDNAPWGVSVSDIDGDTYPDIIISHQLTATANVFLHNRDNTNPAFSKHSIPTHLPARNLVTGDLNNDGKPDIALATFKIGEYQVQILRNMMCHKPKILNESPAYICNNPIELKTIPALNVTYEWKQGSTVIKTGTDPFATATTGGTYTVSASTISPAGECSKILSDPFTVTGASGSVPENPTITVNSPVCAGGQINLSTTTTSGASYKWSGPAGWTSTTTTSSTSIPNVTSGHAGSYSVQIIVGSCKSNESEPKVVDVVAVDNITITSNSSTNSACAPNAVKLTATLISGFSYSWKKGTGTYSTPSTSNTFDAFEDGSYYVKVSNASLGCPDREIGPVRVAILQVPVADFTIGAQKCANAPVQFTSTSTVDPDGLGTDAVAPVRFTWNFGDGKSSTDEHPTNTYTTGGITYNVTLTVSYQGVSGCTNSKTLPVPVSSSTAPVLTSSPTAICPGETATISVSPTFTSVTWEHGATGQTINVTQPGTYTAHATDAGGCVVPKSIILDSRETPQITITASAQTIPSGQSTQLNATGAHTFEWTPRESLNNASIPDPVATPGVTTTYTVTGAFVGGCSSQATITITVDGSLININAPVAFSPNGDSSNDLWIIEGVESYTDCTMTIFDARGRRIYQKKGYTNDWDGTYDQKPVPGGTYYYVFSCPGSKPVTGSVLVFR